MNIFISSTYYDLVPEREAIWSLLQVYNVEIKGMEMFGARTSPPLDTCLNQVDDSDIFVFVVSMRYGSVDDVSGKSFTQLEYERAFRKEAKEILVYLIDEDYGLVYPRFIDKGDKYHALNLFKKQLKKNHTVQYFTNKDDLITKLKADLGEHLSIRKKHIERPSEIEAKLFPFKINDVQWYIFIGYIENEPYEIFTGFGDAGELTRKGIIKYVTDDKSYSRGAYYAFIYYDRFGYKNTIGGIEYEKNPITKRYDRIITKLLQQDTPIDFIIEIVQEMDLVGVIDSQTWKENVIKTLTGKAE